MISIENSTPGFCEFCHKKAKFSINGIKVCSQCGDTHLIKIIGKCSKAVTHAIVTFQIMPRKTYEKYHKKVI